MKYTVSRLLGTCLGVLAVLSLSGCIKSATRADVIGVKVGDPLQMREGIVVYHCEEPTSLSTLWFGTEGGTAECLASEKKAMAYRYKDVHPLVGGLAMTVVKIKYWNGVDADGYMLRVRDLRNGKEYWVDDLDADEVFGLRRSR